MSTALVPEIDSSVINVDPEIRGGEPVFPGTRVPIQRLHEELKQGASLASFLYNYPTVGRDELIKVLDLLFERTIGPLDWYG